MGLVFGVVGCGEEAANNNDTNVEQNEDANQEPEINEEEVLDQAIVNYYANLENASLISLEDFAALLEEDADSVLLLDLRAPEHYEQGHIEGAVSVPAAKIGENLEVIRANAEGKDVFVHCYSGQNAGFTTSLLNATGIPTRSLKGGLGKGLVRISRGF